MAASSMPYMMRPIVASDMTTGHDVTIGPSYALNNTKLVLAVVMFVATLCASLLPVFITRKVAHMDPVVEGEEEEHQHRQVPRWKRYFVLWVGRLSCFAGGVFLSTGFMDLFPDVEEVLEQAKEKLKLNPHFPMAPCLTLLGFFIILTVEQVILVIKESRPDPPPPLNTEHTPLLHDDQESPDEAEDRVEVVLRHNGHHGNYDGESRRSRALSTSGEHHDRRTSARRPYSMEGISNRPLHRSVSREPTSRSSIQVSIHTQTLQSSIDESSHDHYDDLKAHGSLRVVILLVAMSFHAIFEGMAVGLQTTQQSVAELFAALCLHKLVIAAGVGLNLATSSFPFWLASLACFIFSIASPVGVLAGFGVSLAEQTYGAAFLLVNGILQGLACGTFFYVVFFEILPHEFNTGVDRMGKVLALLMGFALVTVYLNFFDG